MTDQSARILVVDDELSMREMASILLRRHGYTVQTASSGHEAIALLEKGETFDLIITDLLMDRGGGLEVLRETKTRVPTCEVVVITAFGTPETAVEAMKNGAYDYVTKPFNVDEFVIVVRQALERQSLIRENLDLRARVQGKYRFADVVGRSAAMKEVIQLAQRAANSPATVLINGESGTGKEVVARALHFGSNRCEMPFVAINCGALPEQLMESELFGHVKGSFTGAHEDKLGLFRSGNKGTVFLDEVSELPLALQVKMLRVLQDRKVRAVGGNREEVVDVRVIAATNQDLERLVEENRFRKDLFYRLNVIRFELPPLRERREDIPPLLEHLQKRLELEQSMPHKEFSPEAIRAILKYDFPGNVRELANVIERASTLATGKRIEVEDLPEQLLISAKQKSTLLGVLPEEGFDLDAELGQIERSYIELALKRTSGNRTQAAVLLGMTFRSLRYRLKKLGFGDDGETEQGGGQ